MSERSVNQVCEKSDQFVNLDEEFEKELDQRFQKFRISEFQPHTRHLIGPKNEILSHPQHTHPIR